MEGRFWGYRRSRRNATTKKLWNQVHLSDLGTALEEKRFSKYCLKGQENPEGGVHDLGKMVLFDPEDKPFMGRNRSRCKRLPNNGFGGKGDPFGESVRHW